VTVQHSNFTTMVAVCGVQQKAALQGFAAKQTARPSARPLAIRATAERKQQQKESVGHVMFVDNIAMECSTRV